MTPRSAPWLETKCIPRRPQGTPLHRVVKRHLQEYLARQAADGRPAPWFVAREFEALLKCGDPDHGRAVLACFPCGEGTVVPFTCKRRGFCPDCLERRMMERSQVIVDTIVGETPVRHWILSLPPPLRYILGYSADHITIVLTAFIEALSQHQRWKAKRMFGLESVDDAQTAAVTAVQRGSANLALNVHFHSLVPDGVFVRDDSGQLVFRELPMPSLAEIAAIAWRACRKTLKALEKRGEWRQLPDVETGRRDTVYGELKIGGDARVVRFRADASTDEHDECIPRNGAYPFDLYAGQYVRAGDRAELLKLAKYILSPPLTHDQVEVDGDDRVLLRYRRPRRDGTECAILDPMTFLSRLAALVPRPKRNTVRFHGVWGPNAHNRADAVPGHPEHDEDECGEAPSDEDRQAWSSMLKQAHVSDIRRCPRCSGKLILLALDSPWLIYRNQRRQPLDAPSPLIPLMPWSTT